MKWQTNKKELLKFSLGYDVEYTETDRKDIQNLAQEIETKYTQYGKVKEILDKNNWKFIELRKDTEYETDDTVPSCCLAMCLDWCLDKLCCRDQKDNLEDDVYMPPRARADRK